MYLIFMHGVRIYFVLHTLQNISIHVSCLLNSMMVYIITIDYDDLVIPKRVIDPLTKLVSFVLDSI